MSGSKDQNNGKGDQGENPKQGPSDGKPTAKSKSGQRRQKLEEQRRAEEAARRRKTTLGIIGLVVGLVVLIGIAVVFAGQDDEADPGSDTAAPPAATAGATPGSNASSGDVAKAPKVTGGFGEKPVIAKPAGDPPTTLIVKDLKVGEGEPVTDTAKSYLWNYAGVSWSDGQTFDSSFDRGESIAFSLDQVIPGWREGLIGIKPGGRRLLVIPPDQAYGEAGSPPAVGPNETLVFVVDLIGPAS